MRKIGLACAVTVLVGVLAAVAVAQTQVPTVAVSAGAGTITLQPSAPIAAGPTRFALTKSGRGETEVVIATLRAGVTPDQLRSTLSGDQDAALSLVFLEASATLSDPAPARELTVELRPAVTYVALSLKGESVALTTFTTTGTANGATAPAPDATIRMADYGFRGPATLPRDGSIRVTNRGTAFHFALAFPMRPGVSAKRAGRALRGGKGIGKIVAGPPVSVQDVISPGSVNDNQVRFARPGRYAMVCFFGAHNRLGMYRIFKVR